MVRKSWPLKYGSLISHFIFTGSILTTTLLSQSSPRTPSLSLFSTRHSRSSRRRRSTARYARARRSSTCAFRLVLYDSRCASDSGRIALRGGCGASTIILATTSSTSARTGRFPQRWSTSGVPRAPISSGTRAKTCRARFLGLQVHGDFGPLR